MSRKRSFAVMRAYVAPNERDSLLSDAIELRLAAAARLELARALYHLRRARAHLPPTPPSKKTPKVGHMTIRNYNSVGSDIPDEMSELNDGLSDDGAVDASIIGKCLCDSISGGLPSYLFTRGNLSNPVVRRRLAANIESMTPKMKRRVMARLRTAVSAARVSGAVSGAVSGVRSGYPSVQGYAGGYPSVGWTGVSVGRCPLSEVAGRFTP